ncbi:tRNA 5-methoxyuridine(34)/uridine 5-oxyacetic acid(34) synthase CmoB [uncultured Campylobacter sp.]|uniref:tRNA 5-methoxyuridine(34)/uridine 5-oxyacetic acid(34) synthase CmoB n=1 Tax=uncultured Campylobacter sp. TaxID=218934 RepID=UPI002609A084|nr:tRNA 5-methoxyuridine(34)/uridine 5-oxyacetic acid(34) synthase CmoB [uncultured Campylobacter sp.]
MNKEQKELLQKIKKIESEILDCKFSLNEAVNLNFSQKIDEDIKDIALKLKPWRKGPFKLNELFIDSEWQSFMKFDILKPFMGEIKDKIVADVGCNNGYYMFKMLEYSPKKIVGFDPSIRCFLQFSLINAIAKQDVKFELLGVEKLPNYELKFDIIFCLGVLYHRQDPLKMLKELRLSLNKDGAVFLDTMFIEDEREVALVPRKTYSRISNIYFLPSISALRNWCERAGFNHFEVLYKNKTNKVEQRKTSWIDGYSLEDFLDKDNENLSFEGYEAPKRVYVKLKI